jgi:hypothetical protein
MVNMEGPDPNPASLSPEEREARLNAVLADVRASHNTAGHIRSLGWVPDDLLDNVTQVCEVRKPFGHWRQPLDPGTPWRRIAEQLSAVPQLNPDELVERLAAADPDELVERLIAADAELAAVTALQLYLGGYGVGPFESPNHR